jgi:hypothetical protein
VAYFYAETGDSEAYSWFNEKINTTNSQVQAQLLQFYAPYLLKLDAAKQDEGIKLLEKLAKENQAYQVRLSAYQSLGLFAEKDGMKEIRKNIRENEKDERLKNIYELMP